MKFLLLALLILGIIFSFGACSGVCTNVQLNLARSKEVYETAEQCMLAMVDRYYPPDREVL